MPAASFCGSPSKKIQPLKGGLPQLIALASSAEARLTVMDMLSGAVVTGVSRITQKTVRLRPSQTLR
jgi:hypothetical protein